MKTVVKNEVENSVKTFVTNEVKAEIKEMEDRKNRQLNLVLFNIHESDSREPESRKAYDKVTVARLFDSIGVNDVEYKAMFRLGKAGENTKSSKPRPLKLVLENKKQRRQILDNAKNIPSNAPIDLKRAIISKDLTEQQRRDSKKKRETGKKTDKVSADKSHENKENNMHKASHIQSPTLPSFKPYSVEMNDDECSMSQRLLVDLHRNYNVYDDDETVMGLLGDSVLQDQVAYVTQL